MISYRWRGFKSGLIGLVVLVLWSAVCIFLIQRVLEHPETIRIVFASVFCVAWLFLILFTVSSILGCDYVKVDRESLTYVNYVLVPVSRRHCPVSEVKQVSIKNRKENGDESPLVPLMVIDTLGDPISLFNGLSIDELEWLKSELIDAMGLNKRIEVPDDAMVLKGNSFESALSIVERPSESNWQMRQDFDGLVVFQRGKFSLFAVFASLMLTAFWNGIVSVFIMNLLGFDNDAPRGLEWLYTAVILIPFVLLGLLFVCLFLLTLLEPLRVTSWTFTANSIDCAWRWLGLGPRWHYEFTKIQSISIERTKRKNSQGNNEVNNDGPLRYCICFRDENGNEICNFDSLNEGEARWIAENVRRVLTLR